MNADPNPIQTGRVVEEVTAERISEGYDWKLASIVGESVSAANREIMPAKKPSLRKA